MSSHSVQRVLYPLLWPFGRLYGGLMTLRREWYERRQQAVFQPSVPTISVGNIGWGGSGKTPVVDWLLGWSAQEGLRAVVLSRGYKASPPTCPFLVLAESTPDEAGDEPLMLARQHPLARVVVDPVRRRAAAWAEDHLAPNLFILDDGFQHLAIHRHLDLVLLKPEDLQSEWGRIIPSGSWREGAATLSRARAILIKATPEQFASLLPIIKRRLGSFDVPVFSFSLQSTGVKPVYGEEDDIRSPEFLSRGYVLFSGVGDPVQVENTAVDFIGVPPVSSHTFADHHHYTIDDIGRMAQEGLPLLCTPKDAVKVAALPPTMGADVWTFSLKTTFGPAWNYTASFPEWWDEAWQAMRLPEE